MMVACFVIVLLVLKCLILDLGFEFYVIVGISLIFGVYVIVGFGLIRVTDLMGTREYLLTVVLIETKCLNLLHYLFTIGITHLL